MKTPMEAFPDYSEDPSDMSEDGDVVHFVAHVRGTQHGTLALPGMKPIPPTGRHRGSHARRPVPDSHGARARRAEVTTDVFADS